MGMNSPDRKESSTPAPNGGSAEQPAKEIFPNFATVNTVLEAAHIGIWSWDITTNRLTWSSNLEAIHRLPAGSFDGTYSAFARDIHSDDRLNVEASLQEALRTQSPYWARYRLSECEGGEDRWLEASGTVLVKDGVPERMLGLCHDITERVKLEAELRSRVKQLETLAQLGERALAEPDLERLLKDAVSTIAMTLS